MNRTNWPLVVRNICEKYYKTPAEIGCLTLNQIIIMACDINTLERQGIREMTPDQMRAENILPPLAPGQPKSLAQQIRMNNAVEAERLKKMSKRQRRKEQERLLAEARARGEA